MKRNLALILFFSMLAGLTACGESSGVSETTEPTGETITPESGYTFRKDWDGETVSFLNFDNPFGMNAKITADSENGEVLNDAMYRQTLALEDNMGVTLEENNIKHEEFLEFARNIIVSGEDTYDFFVVNDANIMTFTQENLLLNLLDFEDLQLNEDWWLHETNDLVRIGDSLYCAKGYSCLLVVDSLNIMLFNEDLAEKLQLETPYGLVKDGSWTLDKFAEYLKAGAALNLGTDIPDTDNVWNYDQPGNGAACSGLLVGCGETSFEVKDGQIVCSAGSERFYNVCDKIASIMSLNKPYIFSKEQYGVGTKFVTNQALFSYGEIKSTQELRSKDFSFGILPPPKYDEQQDRYYCRTSWTSAGFSIPQTAADPEMSAAVMDALNYLSYDIVWPTYREVVLEQKNLRNEESIEILDIILRSGVPAFNTVYSIGSDMISTIGSRLLIGNTDISSIVASNMASIEERLKSLNSQE